MIVPINGLSFINWMQFTQDIKNWERSLPRFDAICGVPNSGLYPAAYIAMKRNLLTVNLADLINDPQQAINEASSLKDSWLSKDNLRYKLKANSQYSNILIVDDSSTLHSNTLRNIKPLIPNNQFNIKYGVVYCEDKNEHFDYNHAIVPQVRLFEWNWYRHWFLYHSLLDLDGVICEDWLGIEREDDPIYVNHILNAKPLYLPLLEVRGIVTNRLEKYRSLTEQWLSKHNVKYKNLYMNNAVSPEIRRTISNHALHKISVYGSDKDSYLFVESDLDQAKIIRKITNKNVLCVETMTILD